MSAATSNSSSAPRFGEVFVVSPDVDMSLKAGQPVAIGFPASGPVLITG